MQRSAVIKSIDPKELDVEFTIDPSKFAALAKEVNSAQDRWIRNPILVWFDPKTGKLRIIDGFHRTSVAQHLELPSIPYIQYEGPDQEFWDARIRESLPHTAIEEDRINDWIVAAWQSEFSHVPTEELEKVAAHVIRHGVKPPKQTLSRVQLTVLEWFKSKASAWKRTEYQLAEIVLRKAGLKHPDMVLVIEKTPTLETAKEVIKGMSNSGVRSGMTPNATPTQAGDYSVAVSSGSVVNTSFQDWLKGKEETTPLPVKSKSRTVPEPVTQELVIPTSNLEPKGVVKVNPSVESPKVLQGKITNTALSETLEVAEEAPKHPLAVDGEIVAEKLPPRMIGLYGFFAYASQRFDEIMLNPAFYTIVPQKYKDDLMVLLDKARTLAVHLGLEEETVMKLKHMLRTAQQRSDMYAKQLEQMRKETADMRERNIRLTKENDELKTVARFGEVMATPSHEISKRAS